MKIDVVLKVTRKRREKAKAKREFGANKSRRGSFS
jgi:hypothetical protein